MRGADGPYLRLDHSADEALRALDRLLSRWERFERTRRAVLLVLPPGLVALAAGCLVLDHAMGFRQSVYRPFAPLLVAAAAVVVAAARPPGWSPRRLESVLPYGLVHVLIGFLWLALFLTVVAAVFESFAWWRTQVLWLAARLVLPVILAALLVYRRTWAALRAAARAVAMWWRPPAWRAPLLSCRELLAAFGDPADRVRGWIDLAGIERRDQPVGPTSAQGILRRDIWCRLTVETRSQHIALRATQEQLITRSRVRRRWRALVVVTPGDRYAPAARLSAPARRKEGALPIVAAHARGRRLVLRVRTPRRRLAWRHLREILHDAGALVPLA